MKACVVKALVILAIALVVLVVPFGLFGVGDALEPWVAVVVGVVTVVLALMPKPLDVIGASLLAFLTLVGANLIADLVGVPNLPILVGLGIAFVVVGSTIFGLLYLKDRNLGWALGAGVAVAVIALLVAPIVVHLLSAKSAPVAEPKMVPSKLDLAIITDGSRHPAPREVPADPALEEFEAHYSVGYTDGAQVRWTLVDGESAAEALAATAQGAGRRPVDNPPAASREGADTALVLLVDGTAPVTESAADLPNLPARSGEVAHWKGIAERAAPAGTPVFALLQTNRRDRLRSWKGFEATGEAISLQELDSQTATDAAFRLAVGAPTSRTDLALATAYQPILLFDRDEPVPRALSISALFTEGSVELCDDTSVLGTDCGSGPILRPRELKSGGTHLRLTTRPPRELQRLALDELTRDAATTAPAEAAGVPGAVPEGTPPPGTSPVAAEKAPGPLPGAGSAIYVHPVSVNRDHRRLLYLDYWWYLTDNPVGIGGGAICGFGLVIAGVTCQNHQSDWEGMTVVVDRTEAKPRAIAVHYAQHDSVIRYGWDELRDYWDNDQRSSELTERIAGASSRPLAYIANGTHATYPFHCSDCDQVAHSERSEGPHRGGTGWIGNETGACGKAGCLQMLPTHGGGMEPALWNAYDGPWGERHCALTYYCDSGDPPSAPGEQGRYEHPAHHDGTGDEQGGFVPGLIEG